MSVQKPGITYSSQRVVANKGKKIVLASNGGSSSGTGVGATTSTPASAASTNLKGASRNTSYTRIKTSADVGNVAASNFKLAARSNTVALYSNKFDYSALRSNLNSNTGFVGNQMRYTAPSAIVQRQDNSMNKFAAAMMAMQVLQQGLGLVGGLNTKSDVKGGGDVKQSGSKGDASGSTDSSYTGLSDMKGAKDSVSLRSAIETANADKTKMQSELTQIESGLDAKKADAEKAESEMKDIKQKVSDQEKVVDKKKEAVEGAETNVKEAEGNVSSSKVVLEDAEKKLGFAGDNVKTATNALTSAKQNLANTSPTLTDGTPNPAYTEAKAAVETAESNKKAADEAYIKANEGKEQALKNYNDMVARKEKADTALTDAKKVETEAKEELKQAEDTLKKLNEKLESAKGAVESYKEDLKKQEKLTKDIKKYDDEIKDQNKRLTELEKKDDEDLKNNDKKMNELQDKVLSRQDKIDTTDGKNTLREKIAAKKNDKALGKFDELQQERNEIQQRIDVRNLMNNVPEKISDDGQAMRKGTGTDGKTIYMIGSKVVDESAYNAKLTSAKAAYNDTPLDNKGAGVLSSIGNTAQNLSGIKLSANNSTPAPAQPKKTTVPPKPASFGRVQNGATNPLAPNTKAVLELLENGKIANSKIGGKMVSYNNGVFMADGKPMDRKELEKMTLG